MNNEDGSHKLGEGKLRHRQETEKRKCLEKNVNIQKEQEKLSEDDKKVQPVKGDARRSPLHWV